ncbi:MAG: glycosyltransferase family 2 protein [Eubacterium sp.]|nr:glycosyltransferase family 2 protein [Eubacterium sp.]
MIKIGVVLVTFNRLDKLKNSLEAFDKQTNKPAYILVVNNASTDGTGEFLQEWLKTKTPYKKYVSAAPTNLGGSGGFYIGMKRAVQLNADWVWVSDDDVYPKENAFEVGSEYIEKLSDTEQYEGELSAIASKVVTDGKIDLMHRRNIVRSKFYAMDLKVPEEEYEKELFPVDIISFAGTIISRKAIEAVGLPERDFFIWFDDTEYSYRLRKYGRMYVIPSLEIIHDVEQAYGGSNITWKDYYGLRNEIYTYKKHHKKHVYMIKVIKKFGKSFLMYLKKDTRPRAKLFFMGIRDGVRGKLGIHPVVKPGWKPEQ